MVDAPERSGGSGRTSDVPVAARPDVIRFGSRDVPISEDGIVVGRANDCDITLDIAGVSRRHVRIFMDEQGVWVQDLGSKNGTLINRDRLRSERRALTSGDRITVGGNELVALAGKRTTYQRADGSAPPRSALAPVALTTAPLTIGRDAANALVLDDPNVSRFHAEIQQDRGRVVLRDLGSRNGTRRNGEMVTRTELAAGDQLTIGAYRLTFSGTAIAPSDDRVSLQLDVRGVTVSVGDRRLLEPTSFSVLPGELVAIIGESGAGKTTLLKAIAGITTPTGGEVLLNGDPIASRLTAVGYVPQTDIVHGLLSVREALTFAARLRLPSDTNGAEVKRAVARVLGQLELERHADTLVGRLSGGQRKRVGVAVELLGRPGILLLDEPATGLDPGLEKKLMVFLRQLSRESRPVVAITHSTKNLALCDKVVVMGRGGVLRFCGSPEAALDFFDVDDFDDIYTALDEDLPAPPPVSARRTSIAAWRSDRSISGAGPAPVTTTPVLSQAAILATRYSKLLLRDHRNLAILLGQAPVLALLIAIGFDATVFDPRTTRIQGPTFLFVSAITAMWLGAIAAAREIIKERAVFLRERAVGVSVRAYLLSKVAVLFVLTALQTVILSAILFGLRPLHASTAGYVEVVVILLLTGLAAVGLGLLASTMARSEDQATSFVPGLLIPQLLFGGSIIPLVGKGVVIKVLAGIMVARWAFAGLGSAIDIGSSPAVVHHYGSLFGTSVGLLIAIVAGFAALFLLIVGLRLRRQHA